MDLADTASIKAACEEIKEVRGERNEDDHNDDEEGGGKNWIDVLCNNAGVMASPTKVTTKQNLELQFGVNHIGHYKFTRLLLPYMNHRGGRMYCHRGKYDSFLWKNRFL